MAESLSSIRFPIFHNSTSSTASNSITSQSLHGGDASPLNTNASSVADANEDEKNPWSFEFSVIMATILSVSAFLTLVGNAMVLTVIYRHRGMRTRTNLFLVNLAIADFLIGIMVMPISISTLVEGRWPFNEDICSLNGWVNALCLITSIHTLMYIGINKYFSICRPLSNPIQLWHIVLMMLAAWLWGALCATMTVTGLNTVSHKPGTSQCGPDYPKELRGYMFHSIVQVTVIILPFCILLFCYIRMFRAIKRHSERLRSNTTVEEDFILTQQKKVAVTLFIVLATFIFMALPYHVYATYTTIKKDKDNFSSYINPIAYCFLYLNSMCNPIIYAFRSPAFREGYKEILCQTPNYVIRDDFNIMRSSRGDSIVPRRRSVASNASTATNTDNPDVRSPTPLLISSPLGEPRTGGGVSFVKKPKRPFHLQKQQTVKELIRSSRRSSSPLVIRRDGDVIVVKSGKIVSVRRESESSSAMSPRRLGDVKEVPYGNSIAQVVFSQLTLGTPSSPLAVVKGNEEDVRKNGRVDNGNCLLARRGPENGTSAGGVDDGGGGDGGVSFANKITNNNDCGDLNQTVFEEETASESDSTNHLLVNGADSNGQDATNSSSDVCALPKSKSYHSIEELSKTPLLGNQSNSQRERLKDRRNAPDLTVEIYKEKRTMPHSSSSEHLPSKLKQFNDMNGKNNDKHGLLALPALSNMAAGIASATTDILLGMPLTPNTRNMLTRSDQQLNRPDATASSSSFLHHPMNRRHSPRGSSFSHSSDNLYNHPRISRYPSLEHLDRPKPLFGTSKYNSTQSRNEKASIV